MLGVDTYFDVDLRKRAADFTRAIAFVNSEMFYHWEIDHENGLKSTYGKKYGDPIVADGRLPDAEAGEVVRVTTEKRLGPTGKHEKFFRVQYDPADLTDNRDFYAGIVTTNVVMALAKEKFGKLTKFEVMRAILMGAQAVHYLDVYTNTSPATYRRYLEYMGLENVAPSDVDDLFEHFDAHANGEQTQAFIDMLDDKYDIALADFTPLAGHQPSYVA